MNRPQISYHQHFGQQIRQSVLQERVYRSRIAGVKELKQRLVTEWANLDHGITSEAVGQWRTRLSAGVRANGGHFE